MVALASLAGATVSVCLVLSLPSERLDTITRIIMTGETRTAKNTHLKPIYCYTQTVSLFQKTFRGLLNNILINTKTTFT